MSTGLVDDEGNILHDAENDIMFARGSSAPTDGTDGYAVGCVFLAEAGTANEVLFTNVGTTSSCDFNVVSTAGGAVVGNTTRVAANYTVLSTDYHLNVNTTAEIRFDANPTTGQVWVVSTNTNLYEITVSFDDNAATINGVNTLTVGGNKAVTLISDGTNLHAHPAQAQLNV